MDIQTALWRGRTTQTVAIDVTGAATTAVFTPASGKRFAVHHLFLSFSDNDATTGDTGTIKFQSGSNDLSGTIWVEAPAVAVGTVANTLEFKNDAAPVFVGRANGEAFNIVTVNAGGDLDMDGFAVVSELEGIL